MEAREAIPVSDVRGSSWRSVEEDQAIGHNTNALMCAALCNNEKIDGAINVVTDTSGRKFDPDDLVILRMTARPVSREPEEAEVIALTEGGKC